MEDLIGRSGTQARISRNWYGAQRIIRGSIRSPNLLPSKRAAQDYSW